MCQYQYQYHLERKRVMKITYWDLPTISKDVPEFYPAARCSNSLRNLAQGNELTIDTQYNKRGRFETRVLHGYQMLDCQESSNWAKAQVTHKVLFHTWECAQRWICTECSASTWAAPGIEAKCLTPQCDGHEMCAQCAPLHKCEAHQASCPR